MDMFRKFSVATAGALLIGLPVLLAALVPDAKASNSPVSINLQSDKGNRLPGAAKGSQCSRTAWPDYETKCLFDVRNKIGRDMPQVRIVDLARREIKPR